ncbi:MAG: sensor histidine kinase [Lachnospiraceae bacterium]|nr:sensor histidine kinase [Lachnospiraceae bacterium]
MRLLYDITELVTDIFETYLVFHFISYTSDKSPKNYIKPSIIAIVGIIILNMFNSKAIIRSVYMILIPTIVILLSERNKRKIHIFYALLSITLVGTMQSLTLNTILSGYKIINKTANTMFSGSLVLIITVILWCFIISRIGNKKNDYCIKGNKRFFVFIALVSLFNASIYSVARNSGYNLYDHSKAIECFLLFFGIALITEILYIIFLHYEKSHFSLISNFNKGYLEIEHEQIKQARSQDKSARIFRHNVREHFNLINYYAERGEMDELLSYLYSLGENVSTLKCKHQTGRDSVDGLIAFENDRLEQYNIKLEVDGALTEFGALSDYELCTLFSNAFQNAIEACIKVPDPTNRRISIHFRSNPPYKILEISNTVKENLKLSDTPLVTTKPDKENHGLGLMQIKQITHSHNGEVIINCTDNVFTLTLELKI